MSTRGFAGLSCKEWVFFRERGKLGVEVIIKYVGRKFFSFGIGYGRER